MTSRRPPAFTPTPETVANRIAELTQEVASLKERFIDRPVLWSGTSWVMSSGSSGGIITVDNIAALKALNVTGLPDGQVIMTKVQRDAIGTPEDGLMIYQTDGTAGVKARVGGAWVTVNTTADP